MTAARAFIGETVSELSVVCALRGEFHQRSTHSSVMSMSCRGVAAVASPGAAGGVPTVSSAGAISRVATGARARARTRVTAVASAGAVGRVATVSGAGACGPVPAMPRSMSSGVSRNVVWTTDHTIGAETHTPCDIESTYFMTTVNISIRTSILTNPVC